MSRYFENDSEFTPTRLVSPDRSKSEQWQPLSYPDVSEGEIKDTTQSKEEFHQEIEAEAESISDAQSDPPPDDQTGGERPEQNADQEPTGVPPDLETIQEEAFNAGVSQGRKQAEIDFGTTLSALSQLCDQLNGVREIILKNARDEMVDLVSVIAEKIIKHSVSEQRQTIIDTVETAIQQAVKSSEIYIYLNPEDVVIIEDRAETFIASVNGLENIIIKSDPMVERGGCRVESENCTVDATISGQLNILKQALKNQS